MTARATAVTATGVSCRLSARRRAVTMTDSMASASSAAGGSAGACAAVTPARNASGHRGSARSVVLGRTHLGSLPLR